MARGSPPQDPTEEHPVRKLAGSRHAPADWMCRAKLMLLSWQGLRTRARAAALACHHQTVRERRRAWKARGIDGLGDRAGAGRKGRITESERSTLVALVARWPPGRQDQPPDGSLGSQDEAHAEEPAHWTVNALTEAAQQQGIQIKRSQVRRILLTEGVPWRQPRHLGPGAPIGTSAQKDGRRLALDRPGRDDHLHG